MKRFFGLQAAVVLFCAMCAARAETFAPAIREIKSPTFSQPAFVLPGEKVPVTLEVSAKGKAAGAILKPSFGEGRLETEELRVALSAGKNEFVVPTRKDLPPGLYDLCLDFEYGGFQTNDCQKHAVAVVKSFGPPFTFVQMTDFHVGDPRADRQFPGVDIDRVRIEAIEAANRQNPAFILITGDVTAYPETYREDYPKSVDILVSHARAPLVIVPGNHDFYTWSDDRGKILTDGSSYWKDFFGPAHRVLDYGPFRFVLFDTYDWGADPRNQNTAYHFMARTGHTYQGTLSPAEFKWVREALASRGRRVPIFVAHHGAGVFEANPTPLCRDCISRKTFQDFVRSNRIPYYFYGHIHRNDEFTDGPTQYYATTSVGSDVSEKQLWGIRVVHAKKNLTLETRVLKLFEKPPMKESTTMGGNTSQPPAQP